MCKQEKDCFTALLIYIFWVQFCVESASVMDVSGVMPQNCNSWLTLMLNVACWRNISYLHFQVLFDLLITLNKIALH